MKFVLRPDFQTTGGASGEDFMFSSPVLSYIVAAETPKQPEAAAVYRSFCDTFALLNSLLQPGGLPPFARLELNEQLAKEGALPGGVRLTIAPHERFGNREVQMRAGHAYTWRLSEDDVAKIERARAEAASFRRVDLDEYRRAR